MNMGKSGEGGGVIPLVLPLLSTKSVILSTESVVLSTESVVYHTIPAVDRVR